MSYSSKAVLVLGVKMTVGQFKGAFSKKKSSVCSCGYGFAENNDWSHCPMCGQRISEIQTHPDFNEEDLKFAGYDLFWLFDDTDIFSADEDETIVIGTRCAESRRDFTAVKLNLKKIKSMEEKLTLLFGHVVVDYFLFKEGYVHYIIL